MGLRCLRECPGETWTARLGGASRSSARQTITGTGIPRSLCRRRTGILRSGETQRDRTYLDVRWKLGQMEPRQAAVRCVFVVLPALQVCGVGRQVSASG